MASRWDAPREPDISSNRRATTYCNTAEDGCTRIDNNIIFDDRVAGTTFEQGAMIIYREPLGSQRYALVKADTIVQLVKTMIQTAQTEREKQP